MKGWLLNHCPDGLFPALYNLQSRIMGRGSAIMRVGGSWLVHKEGMSLLSPTPKFIGFGMADFIHNFERHFRIEEGDTCLDVGACIGDTTVPMAIKAGKAGHIIAVEPHPLNVKYLRRNTAHLGNVEIVEIAVSDRKGIAELFAHPSPTGHSLMDGSSRRWRVGVLTGTLDSILKDRKIHFAKIDVQGTELAVLAGAPKLLWGVDRLIVETHFRDDPSRRTHPAVLKALAGYGFSQIEYAEDNGMVYAWRGS